MSYPLLAQQGGREFEVDWALPAHALLSLDEEGMIVDCDAEAGRLFGYRPLELEGRHISFLLPELARMPVLRDNAVNPRLAFLCHCGKHFTGCRREGWSFPVELFVNRVESAAHEPVLLMLRAAESATESATTGHAEALTER
jgi:PAS domain S-box-containing protein